MFESKIVVDDAEQKKAPQEPALQVPINTAQTPPFTTPAPEQKKSEQLFITPQPKPEKKKGKSNKAVIIIASILGVIILGAGGTYAAYVKGYIALPFLDKLLVDENVLREAVQAMHDAQSGKVDFAFTVAVEPKTEAARPLMDVTDASGISLKDQADIADLKSRVRQFRTGLSLYFDDNNAYPASLDELDDMYLVETSAMNISYVPTSDKKEYVLEGKLVINGTERIFTINEKGTEVDTFPKTASSSGDISEMLDDLFEIIPGEVEISAASSNFTGSTSGTASPDSEGMFSGLYRASGTQFEIALETRMVNGKPYLMVTKFPALEFLEVDMTPLLNRWISIDKDEVLQYMQSYGSSIGQSELFNVEDSLSQAESKRISSAFFSSIIEKEFIVVEKNAKDKTFGSTAYNGYVLDIRPELFEPALLDFLQKELSYCAANVCAWEQAGLDASEMKFEDVLEWFTEYEESGIVELMQMFDSVTDATLYVAKNKSGYILETSTIFTFPESFNELSNKQGRIGLTLSFGNINETPAVEAPTDTLSIDEVMMLLQGYSESEWTFYQQTQTVDMIRKGLKTYHAQKDAYPDSLDALVRNGNATTTDDVSLRNGIKKYAQVTISPEVFETTDVVLDLDEGAPLYMLDDYDVMYGTYEVFAELPIDKFTGKPFVYVKTENGYTLTYTIKKPENTKEVTPALLGKYVEGENTANQQVLSVEAESAMDSDGDGLTGAQEAEYGTDPTNKDTDADGATDFEEIQAQTDQLDKDDNPESRLGGIDTDEDGLSDLDEQKYGTNIRLKDTDLDGYSDKNEVEAGYNPLSASTVKTYGMRVADGEWIRGSAESPKITIMTFNDYQSPYSVNFEQTLISLLDAYPNDIRIVYKHYPLTSLYPQSDVAAQAAECAGAQGKFWEMHEQLYENSDTLTRAKMTLLAEDIGLQLDDFDACVNNEEELPAVQEDRTYGELMEVSGTPTSFINGDMVSGAQSLVQLTSVIDSYLEEL